MTGQDMFPRIALDEAAFSARRTDLDPADIRAVNRRTRRALYRGDEAAAEALLSEHLCRFAHRQDKTLGLSECARPWCGQNCQLRSEQ